MTNGEKGEKIQKTERKPAAGKTSQASARAEERTLTAKQQAFIDEYLIDLNGTQAYLRAFPGVKETTARANAARLLANADIQDAIAEKRAKTAEKLEITREMAIQQLGRLSFSDPRKLYDAYGRIKPIHELDDDTAAAVQSIEVEMRQIDGLDEPPVPVLKVRMADRKGALDSLIRAQGWNMPDKIEHTGKNGGPIEHDVRVVLVPPKQKAEVAVTPIRQSDED